MTDLMIMYSECVVFNCNFDHLLITHIISEYVAGSINERVNFMIFGHAEPDSVIFSPKKTTPRPYRAPTPPQLNWGVRA